MCILIKLTRSYKLLSGTCRPSNEHRNQRLNFYFLRKLLINIRCSTVCYNVNFEFTG